MTEAIGSWKAPESWTANAKAGKVEWSQEADMATAATNAALPSDAQVIGAVQRTLAAFLFGMAAIIYGLSRFAVEFVREPDVQLGTLSWGLTMGQTLTVPMLLAGVWLVATAKGRRKRIEPVAGLDSVA